MIEAAFFARFHAEKGPIVLHQWPEGAITCTQRSRRKPLLDFSSISEFVIPRQDLCQQPISICFDGLRIIGHPVCLVDAEKYARNEYMFNFCMVVKEHVEFSAYEKAVDKIAKVLSEAEVQEDYLLNDEAICLEDATDESDPERYASKVQAFCENCVEDLNRYNECVIPLTDAHELNIKLFAPRPPGPVVEPFHVPLSTVDLVSMIDESWDLTMHRVAPLIDGVNHVARIADYANADLALVQQAIRQFVRFDLVVLVDIFQYGAIYAPTPQIQQILFDNKLQDECASIAAADGETVSRQLTVRLYTSLSHGVPLKEWMADQQALLHSINVRRFIFAGLLHGIIYRVHRFALKDPLTKLHQGENDDGLEHMLDNPLSFDEICTALSIAPQDLLSRLKSRQDVSIIER